MKDALDARYKMKVPSDRCALSWLVGYAGTLVTKFAVGAWQKTAYQRLRGKPFKQQLPELGECILYLPPNKLDARFEHGVYLGLHNASNELHIGCDTGVVEVRTMRRRPPSSQRVPEEFGKVRGVPWKPQPETDDDMVRAPFVETGIDGSQVQPAVGLEPGATLPA